MNVLQISASADSGGGGRVMQRLHHEFNASSHVSRILARLRQSPDAGVHTVSEATGGSGASLVGRWADYARMQLDEWFGAPSIYGWTARLPETRLFQDADLVQLHNLHGWYFDYRQLPQLSSLRPVVWTLHDMWAFTGHCAYSYICERWMTGCHDCPLLVGEGRSLVEPRPTLRDRTAEIWRQKRALYRDCRLHIVTPSEWLADLARQSILEGALSIQCIPNGVDLRTFHPIEQGAAREALGIPRQSRVALFVAAKVTQGRKGLSHLVDALQKLDDRSEITLLTIGAQGAMAESLQGYAHISLGQVSDEEVLNRAYNAADLFVTPTLADNQPLVVVEALATGTPVVAFRVGGIPEMVHHLETGYLAEYKDADDLAEGIRTILRDPELSARMASRCREIAEERYDLGLQARRYVALYHEAIDLHRREGEIEDG